MDIYHTHEKAFAQVSAYVVLDATGRLCATVAFKFPPPGHGERRLWCYVHILGTEMVRGYADGYGYDKRSAAFASACERLKLREVEPTSRNEELALHIGHFQHACIFAGGEYWDRALAKEDGAGYTVLQAV